MLKFTKWVCLKTLVCINCCEFFDKARQKTQSLASDKHKFFNAAVSKKMQQGYVLGVLESPKC
jgi:hypothetical protein